MSSCDHPYLHSPEKIENNNKNTYYTDYVDQQYSIYLVQCWYALHHLFYIITTFSTQLNTIIIVISTGLNNIFNHPNAQLT